MNNLTIQSNEQKFEQSSLTLAVTSMFVSTVENAQSQGQHTNQRRMYASPLTKRLFLLGIYASVLLLNGCTGIVGFWMAVGGVAAIPVAGYELTRDRSVDHNLKPYGAHWVKEGMTRESRRADLIACGSPNGEEIEFSQDQISREKNPSEPNGAAAYLRLRDKVGACMQSKGYTPVGDLQFLGGCDARCLYP